MIKKLLLLSTLFLLLVSCLPQAPFATPTPLPSLTAPPTEIPTVPVETLAPNPEPTTLPTGVTPNAPVISPENAASLQVWQQTTAQAPGLVVWEAGGQAIGVSGLGGVGVYRLDPLTEDHFYAVAEPWFVSDISPSGLLVVRTAQDNPIVVSDARSGQDVLSVEPVEGSIAVALAPDGQTVGVASTERWAVLLYSIPGGEPAGELTGFETAAPVYRFIFSPSRRSLVWIARGTVQLMDITSQDLMPALNHEDFVNAIDVALDDRLVATSAGATVENNFTSAIYLWDGISGERLHLFPVTDMPQALNFSPDGRLLAADNGSGVDLWNMETFDLVTTLQGHTGQVVGIAFSPDGRSLASVSEDGALVVWRVADA